MPRGSKPGERRGGRKKGTTNKLTRDVKLAIENAFTTLGGERYLVKVGKRYPQVFSQLLGKLLPLQITGKDGAPIKAETKVQHAVSEATLQRASDLLARALTSGSSPANAPTDPNGPVLPAPVRAGPDGHGASMALGQDSGGAA